MSSGQNYTTANDSVKARRLAARWSACSEDARQFAASYMGHFPGKLPHVVAEAFDKGRRKMLEKVLR